MTFLAHHNESACTKSEAIVHNQLLHATFIVAVVICPIAILLNGFLICILQRTTRLHRNVRLLLENVCAAAIAFCVCFVGRGIHFSVAQHQDPCGLVMTTRRCIALTLPFSAALLAHLGSAFAVVVERFVATRSHASYDQSATIRLTVVLIVVCWLYGPLTEALFLIAAPGDQMIAYCSGLFASLEAQHVFLKLMIVGNFLASIFLVVSFLLLIVLNRRKLRQFSANRATTSLSSRLQLRHNIEVAEMLLPSIAIQCAVWACIVVVSGILIYSEPWQSRFQFADKVAYLHLAYLGCLLYSILHPILCLTRMRMFRREIMSIVMDIRRLSSTPRVSREDLTRESAMSIIEAVDCDKIAATTRHFQLLDTMWKGPPQPWRTSSLKHKLSKPERSELKVPTSLSFSSLRTQEAPDKTLDF